jgi:arylsulfatase A-like enzyme
MPCEPITVSFVDALVGRVIDAVDKSPHAENTWIVLWSDHGWSLGEKEHWGKHVPWRESVRMPLLVVPPNSASPTGFTAGTRCDARVSLLDLYPTLLDACSLAIPPRVPLRGKDTVGLEGKSLLPLIADPTAEWNEAVVSTIGRGTHSVSTDRWRFIRYFDGSEELYDLRDDPHEWFNFANKAEYAKPKRELTRHIPEDQRLKQFVRWGRWKCVFPAEGEPMLFDYQGEFGISEQNDLVAEHPEVIAEIRRYLDQSQITARRVTMPE